VPSHPNHVKFGIFLSHLLISVKHAANRCIIKMMKLGREGNMCGKVQTLRNLALLSILLGLTGSFGSWVNIGVQAEIKAGDVCPSQGTTTVGTEDELKKALADPNCEVIQLRPRPDGYELNLNLENIGQPNNPRERLTLTKLPLITEPRPILKGREAGQQTIVINNSKNIILDGLEITQGKGNAGVAIIKSENITLKNNIIYGHPAQGVIVGASSKAEISNSCIGKFEQGECPYVAPSQQIGPKGNGVGVRIEGGSTITIVDSYISGNDTSGIQVNGSSTAILQNVTIKNNGSHGISIIDSAVAFLNITIANNQGSGISADRLRLQASIQQAKIYENAQHGIYIVSAPTEIQIQQSDIYSNKRDGILAEGSRLAIQQSDIYRNGGCGLRKDEKAEIVHAAGARNTNVIVGNKEGNLCWQPVPGDLRKFEAKIPKHFTQIQEALQPGQARLYPEEARENPGARFVIQIEPGTYRENLCIRESTFLIAPNGGVTLEGSPDKPVIDIGSDICKFVEEPLKTDATIKVDIDIKGLKISKGQTGVRAGTAHQSNKPVFLTLGLEDLFIENNQGPGVEITASNNNKVVATIIKGTQNLSAELDCTQNDPAKQELQSKAKAQIRNNQGDGIKVSVSGQARAEMIVNNVVIEDNKGNGLSIQDSRTKAEQPITLDIAQVSIANNTHKGLAVSVEASAGYPPSISIFRSSLSRNQGGGLFIQSMTESYNPTVHISLVDVHIMGNGGAGVELRGQLTSTLTTTADITEEQPKSKPLGHYCGVFENKGPGIIADLPEMANVSNPQAALWIKGLRVENNTKDGIKVSNFSNTKIAERSAVEITNSQISNNKGDGFVLEDRPKDKRFSMTTLIENNLITGNTLWGITRHIRLCLSPATPEPSPPPDNTYNGFERLADKLNRVFNNGKGIKDPGQQNAGYKLQVCPEGLATLMEE
jgi:hypothetical protein